LSLPIVAAVAGDRSVLIVVSILALGFEAFLLLFSLLPDQPRVAKAMRITNFYSRRYLWFQGIFWTQLMLFVVWRLWVQSAKHDALFKVVRCAVRKYYGHDVVSTSRFCIAEFLCACPSWYLICAAVAGHLDLLGMYLLRGPNRASGRPTAGLRYRSTTPVARCSDGCERGKERG
jgi:hypothetical protein